MGVAPSDKALVAPHPKGIIDPATGRPIGSDSAFFSEINDELADKGFLVTSTRDSITRARTGSLMWMQFGLARAVEGLMQVSGPRYDMERFGVAPRFAAPVRRHDRRRYADQQDGAGAPQGLRPDAGAALRHPGWVCANGGGYYHYSYSVVRGCDRVVPVDILRAGLSPRQKRCHGVLLLQKIRRTGTIER